MPMIEERFDQPQAVTLLAGGVMKLHQPDSIAAAGPGVGSLLPGRAPPSRGVAPPTP